MIDTGQRSGTKVLDHRQPAVRKGPPRILVVDDNRDAAHTLARLLTLLGFAGEEAFSGRGALAAIEEQLPDLVFLDLGMAQMDGFETARRIKARSQWQSLPLIALTGLGQEQDRQRTRDAGFAAHLVKPVSLAVLEQKLEEFLPQSAGRVGDRSRAGGPAKRLPTEV